MNKNHYFRHGKAQAEQESDTEAPIASASAAALAVLSLRVEHMRAGWTKSFVALQAVVQRQQSHFQVPPETSSHTSAQVELDGRVKTLQDGLQKLQQELAEQKIKSMTLAGVWDTTVLRLGQIEQKAVCGVGKSVQTVEKCLVDGWMVDGWMGGFKFVRGGRGSR
jgi:hypothetical protein